VVLVSPSGANAVGRPPVDWRGDTDDGRVVVLDLSSPTRLERPIDPADARSSLSRSSHLGDHDHRNRADLLEIPGLVMNGKDET
jgi:hypothetical protein